jgi:hypothetical protein
VLVEGSPTLVGTRNAGGSFSSSLSGLALRALVVESRLPVLTATLFGRTKGYSCQPKWADSMNVKFLKRFWIPPEFTLYTGTSI